MFVGVYYAMFLFLHSPWNKERIYRLLISGDRQQQRIAAEDLIYYRAQKQLVRALKSNSSATRDLAVSSLWQLWYHAAGDDAFRMIEASEKAIEKNDFVEGLNLLNRLVRKHPRFAEGRNRRGTLYWMLGQYDLAIADCEVVLSLNPEHFGAWQGLSMCQFHLGDYAKARRSVRTALRIHPHDESAQKFLQRCEEMLRRAPPRSTARGDLA